MQCFIFDNRTVLKDKVFVNKLRKHSYLPSKTRLTVVSQTVLKNTYIEMFKFYCNPTEQFSSILTLFFINFGIYDQPLGL